MLKILFLIISSLSLLYMLYFVITAMGLFVKKKDSNSNSDKKNKFAILIAARNEEAVIKNLIISLNKQNYPLDKYEIIVIINNCVDNTKMIVQDLGVNVIECKEEVRSKGDVLKYTFYILKDRSDIDAYVIFDADNVVHRNFLLEMNKAINCGYSFAQGFRDTKNIYDNWLSSSYALLYYIQSLFINKSRYNLGRSAFLNGTGFMVKKSVIDKYGFNPVTLTEDIELTAFCALNGEKIAFVEKAITYDEQVTSFKVSLNQRKRWSFGTIQCLKTYCLPLLKTGIRNGSIDCFDVILFYLSVIFQVVTFFMSVGYFIYFAISFDNMIEFLIVVFSCFLILYIVGVIFRLILFRKNKKSIKDSLGGIFLFDLFLFSWGIVSFISLFKKDVSWDQIKHNRNVNFNDLNI